MNICFVCPTSYQILNNIKSDNIVGPDVAIKLLGEKLIQKKY